MQLLLTLAADHLQQGRFGDNALVRIDQGLDARLVALGELLEEDLLAHKLLVVVLALVDALGDLQDGVDRLHEDRRVGVAGRRVLAQVGQHEHVARQALHGRDEVAL